MTPRGRLNYAALGPEGQTHTERLQPSPWQVSPMGTGRGTVGKERDQTSPDPQQRRRFMNSNAAACAFPFSGTAPWRPQCFPLPQPWRTLVSFWRECHYK